MAARTAAAAAGVDIPPQASLALSLQKHPRKHMIGLHMMAAPRAAAAAAAAPASPFTAGSATWAAKRSNAALTSSGTCDQTII